jgi:hypothetical protein
MEDLVNSKKIPVNHTANTPISDYQSGLSRRFLHYQPNRDVEYNPIASQAKDSRIIHCLEIFLVKPVDLCIYCITSAFVSAYFGEKYE